MSRPRVVIIGGGFAGLYAARGLQDAAVDITVIDRHNHHLFQPMLYQVATAALAPEAIATPIRSVFSGQRNVDVVLAEVTTIDAPGRLVTLADGTTLPFDYCLVCTGVRHSYFGRDAEWEPLAPGLKTIEDALDIRRRVLLAFELAEREKDPVKRHAHLTFVVVGAGPTGVEVAGAIAEVKNYALAKDFRRIDPREATVLLLEGGSRVLPSYPAQLSEEAKRELRRLGVEVRTEMLVSEVTPGWVRAGGWTIPTHTVVWAAGNVGSPLLRTLGAPLDAQGRALVEPDCTVPGHPNIFVLGDTAHIDDGKGGALPGIAPVAIQTAQYAARCISGDLRKEPRRPFSYWDKGQLAVIGRGQAVADIGRFEFGGFIAWLLWIFIHIFFLIGFRNRVMVMFEWAWAYFTYARGARLITEGRRPGAP
ncbi:MAG: NAD(P)/FAD-dependent oxidoreductase [Gemmatimonadales bacterium]|nr:NAD(P)/FAD-dependent oxidoreductase [Gemmatimonadales bacterium]